MGSYLNDTELAYDIPWVQPVEVLQQWLRELLSPQRVLDLGSGPGSFDYSPCAGVVIAIDVDPQQLPHSPKLPAACAESSRLPFPGDSFDLVICHHSLEHFRDAATAIREIRRILKPGGRLFVSVPDGSSLSDRLYRLMLAGGGHVQRFRFEGLVGLVEREAGLHLAASKRLFSSFLYVDKRNFLPAPRGPLPGPFPRRVRWLGRLPGCFFGLGRLVLNVGTRFLDRHFGSRLSMYGWAFAFTPDGGPGVEEAPLLNVCMHCGAAFREEELPRFAWTLYRCPRCQRANVFFKPAPKRGLQA